LQRRLNKFNRLAFAPRTNYRGRTTPPDFFGVARTRKHNNGVIFDKNADNIRQPANNVVAANAISKPLADVHNHSVFANIRRGFFGGFPHKLRRNRKHNYTRIFCKRNITRKFNILGERNPRQ
jgi:hypothetical protein